jgi:hypothetical protein
VGSKKCREFAEVERVAMRGEQFRSIDNAWAFEEVVVDVGGNGMSESII